MSASATLAAPEPAAVKSAIAALTTAFGNRAVTSQAVRQHHGANTTWLPVEPPDAVVFPQSAEDVQQVIRLCAQYRVPVIPYGAGTSLEGGVNAPQGGVCLDFRDMNRVLTVHQEDFDCVVEPGVTRLALNEHLRDLGLFFPVDPGADASLGGMASTRASGTTAVRYGTMKDNVLALKVVLPNGEIMSTARRAKKSSAGYDLTRLIVGAEGTLGVITELTLKLHAIPEAVSAAVCRFPSVRTACDAAILAIQNGVPLARAEILDAAMVQVCNAYSKLGLPEEPMLFLEFNGTDAGVSEQAERFGDVVKDLGVGAFEWAKQPEDRSRLWKARHDMFWALCAYRSGAKVVVSDVCVPISRLAECVEETTRDVAASGLMAPIVGHAGDGNFHAAVLVMMEDDVEVARTRDFLERLAERALAMEGTCTGEHGIGQGKRKFMEPEYGRAAVGAMRAIKRALDPFDIMNPGKVL